MSTRVVASNPPQAASEQAGRFEQLEVLGEGGMAVVYKVRDTATGRIVALKRLRPLADSQKSSFQRELFEREYHTLTQLAHPRVVEVYDYAIDEQGPFYTMELLDGGDLQELVPVDWRRACAVVRDVCSALALLHSRRMVHRDISPRNIRLTADGAAKLFDLGAMAPMGPARDVVGTPAICAPEVVHSEQLDARADLYSLGCTLYYALVGKHAYPAASFRQLPLMWQSPPARAAKRVEGLPAELDALIMSLISVDRDARPVSAAEVMDRLTAIAGLPANEQLLVSHAYLSSPILVGQEGSLARLRKDLERARTRSGRSAVILGGPGLGRSRLLDAVLLDAKLAGALMIRADAVDAQEGEEGVVTALGRRLLAEQPELARRTARPHARVLAHLFPELLEEGTQPEAFGAALQRRSALQQALRAWFDAVSDQQPLVVGVDDFEQVDEFSAAFVALLAHQAHDHRLMVVATADSGAADPPLGAMKLLVEASRSVKLRRLRGRDTEALLRSVFGDVPNIQRLASRVHELSVGNPRDVMALSQHLVEGGVITYASGAWVVPNELNEADLPRSMADAMATRVASLDEDALDLARALATDLSLSLDLEGLRILTGHRDRERLMRSVDSLLVAGILRGTGQRFELSQRGWVAPLSCDMDDATRRRIHLRLAELFDTLGDAFRRAQNLLRGGDDERGLQVLVDSAVAETAITDRDPSAYARVLRELPPDWRETYEQGIELCRREGRPRDTYTLVYRMGSLATQGTGDPESVVALIDMLVPAIGLDLLPELEAIEDPAQRIGKMFELATKRFHETDERERLFQPAEALSPLAATCVQALGAIASRLDLELLERLPPLAPLKGLAPAMGILEALTEGLRCRITARTAETVAIYERLLEGLNRWKGDDTHRHYVAMGVMSGLGYLEAPMGRPRALEWADKIEAEPMYEVNALLIRMVYHLWQGDAAHAEECRQVVELLRVQNNPPLFQEGLHLMGELVAHTCSDDLIRVKQLMPQLARRAEQLPAWLPIAHFLRGEYERIRSARVDALSAHQLAAGMVEPGRHQMYCEISGAYLAALNAVGKSDEARDRGTERLAAALTEGLGYTTNFIRMPLAIAHARTGEHALAADLAERALAELDRPEMGNLLKGLAHETRARVAIEARDREAFEKHAEACGGLFRQYGNRSLITKHERLLDDAQRAGVAGRGDQVTSDPDAVDLTHLLSECIVPQQRAERALGLMLEASKARSGALFAVDQDGPTLAAYMGILPETDVLLPLVRETLLAEVDEETDVTATDHGVASTAVEKGLAMGIGGAADTVHTVLVAHSEEGDFIVTGLALFVVPRGQAFAAPAELATRLSRYWHAIGDATALGTQAVWSRTLD